MKKIKVGISHGDPNGISYEIILKALSGEGITELCTPVIFGIPKLVQRCRRNLHLDEFNYQTIKSLSEKSQDKINVIDACGYDFEIAPGTPTPESGRAAVVALKAACDALQNGEIDVLVTAPLCKETANSEEFPFPGHTEFLEERFGNDNNRSLMILFNDSMRVALATTHLPISKVSEAITVERIVDVVTRFNQSLNADFIIRRPKIAVLSLNPHCGDGGLLGSEETQIIIPAIEECRKKNILAFGPFAADGFFAAGLYKEFDGVVAMYHDQGLAAFKALAGQTGVNYTAGLDVVRTSPDHGTAYDIAWQGKADPQSMREAIYRAIDIFRARQFTLTPKPEATGKDNNENQQK